MSKDYGVVFVDIVWMYSKERVMLDLGVLRRTPGAEVRSREVFDSGLRLDLRPKAFYRFVPGKGHVIQLKYQLEDHPKLKRGGYECGVSTIKIDASLTRVRASWKGDVKIDDHDGAAKKCKLEVEQSSPKKKVLVEARSAQGKFKKRLLEIDDCCAVTGERLLALLDAAHIQEVKDDGPDVPENGILLRADLHRLYDAGYFVIEPDGHLKLSRRIPKKYRELLQGKIHSSVMSRIAPYLVKRTRILL